MNKYHIIPGSKIIDSFICTAYNANQTRDGMFHARIIIIQQSPDKLELLILIDQKNIAFDQLVDQGLAQFRRDLQGVYAQGQQNLHHTVDVLLLEICDQFGLVHLDHTLGY
jgi:hypothetical protein